MSRALTLTLLLAVGCDAGSDSGAADAGCLCWGLMVTPADTTQSAEVHDWLEDGGRDCGQELPTNIEESYFVCEEDYTSQEECDEGAQTLVENAEKTARLELSAECVCLCDA